MLHKISAIQLVQGLILCLFSVSAFSQVHIKPGVATISPFENASGIVRDTSIEVTVFVNAKLSHELKRKLVFTPAIGSLSSVAAIDDSVVIPAGNRGEQKLKLRIKLKGTDCLPSGESINITLEDFPVEKFEIKVNPILVATKFAYSLVQDTSFIDPVPTGKIISKNEYVIEAHVRFQGVSNSDAELSFEMPEFSSGSGSHPEIQNKSAKISADHFKSGCPVVVPVPLVVKLKTVTPVYPVQQFYVRIAGQEKHVHLVYISDDTNKLKIHVVTEKPDSVIKRRPFVGFTHACYGGLVLTVAIDTIADSHGTIYVHSNINIHDTTYLYPIAFDPSNFAIWLEAVYRGKTNPDCAAYLSRRIKEELIEMNDGTVTEKPVTSLTKDDSKTKVEKEGKKDDAGKDDLLHLDNATTTLNPIYHKDSVGHVFIPLKFTRDSLPAKDISVKLSIDKQIFPFKPEFFTPNPIVLKKVDWKALPDSTGFFDSVEVGVYNRGLKAPLDNDAFASIKIDGDEKSFHALRLTESGMYNPSSTFWMDIGSNFDLLDEIKPNNLYMGVFMFEKDIALQPWGKKYKNIGFTGGVYETKSSSLSSSLDSGYFYVKASSSVADTMGKFPYFRDTGSISTTTSVQNIGIFFSPHIRLSNKPSDDYGFHAYFAIYFEMLWQRAKTSADYTKAGLFETLTSTSANSDIAGNLLPRKDLTSSSDFRSQFIGVGFPLYIKEKNFSLYINDNFGVCNQRVAYTPRDGLNMKLNKNYLPPSAPTLILSDYSYTRHRINPFFLLQFRLTEETYGISFTGEVRGLILKDSKPLINLALSKKFDLADIFRTLVKPLVPIP